MSTVTATGVVKRFRRGTETVTALDGVDLVVDAGEVVALVGPSGSGKSTLLAVLCGWETPDAGTVRVGSGGAGRDEPALVPQALGLVPDLSLADNVLLPARLARAGAAAGERAAGLLSAFGVEHLADRYPHQASLGEQQRAAVARALVVRPTVLLADEPTAHQDRGHADALLDALLAAARAGTAVLLATHDKVAWSRADRVVSMRDGRVRPGAPS